MMERRGGCLGCLITLIGWLAVAAVLVWILVGIWVAVK
jgi:hypothetical protein